MSDSCRRLESDNTPSESLWYYFCSIYRFVRGVSFVVGSFNGETYNQGIRLIIKAYLIHAV